MQTSLKFENLDQVMRDLKQRGKSIDNAVLTPAAREGMFIILNAWRSGLAKHRKTGHFEKETKARIDGKGDTWIVSHVGALEADKETAIAMNAFEHGHIAKDGSHVEARPELRNAVRRSKSKVREVVNRKLRDACDGD